MSDWQDDGDLAPAELIASLIGIGDGPFRAAYADALVIKGRPLHHPNLYSFSRVAELISQASGHALLPNQIGELIGRADAIKLLATLGIKANHSMLTACEAHGLRRFTVGMSPFYLYPQVRRIVPSLYPPLKCDNCGCVVAIKTKATSTKPKAKPDDTQDDTKDQTQHLEPLAQGERREHSAPVTVAEPSEWQPPKVEITIEPPAYESRRERSPRRLSGAAAQRGGSLLGTN